MRLPRSIPGIGAAAVVSAVLLAGASLATAAATAAIRPAARAARAVPGSASPHGRPAPAPAAAAPGGTAPQLHVSGNELVDSSGQRVVLHGVDRSGTEYMCVQGNGIFDGPHHQAAVSAMKKWDVNAVRVPLNEACWNGESYVNPAYAGASYQNAIKAYVHLLNANGIVAILDLHWTDGAYTGPSSGCSSAQAVCQKPMPDAAQSIPFWTSVAHDVQGQRRGHLRPVQRAVRVPGHGQHRRAAGTAGWTVAPARASPTRWPGCRAWSTRSAPPAPPT